MTTVLNLLAQHFIVVTTFILAVLLFTHIFRQQDRPNTSIAWILCIILIPYIGVPAYIIFGGRKLRRHARRKEMIYPVQGSVECSSKPSKISSLLASYDMPDARQGNQVHLVNNNGEVYARLIKLIDESTTSIHLMTFILSTDEIGRGISTALAKKAKQGVKVRLLVDGLGSFKARFFLLRELRRAGVEVGIFMRMLPVHRRWSANLRNHRKIAVFDGQTALVGGMNIGAEYLGPTEDKCRWIDTMTYVRGPVVADLNNIFVHDWEFATNKKLDIIESQTLQTPGTVDAQIVASGPDVRGDPLYDLLIAAIYSAKSRIWITTPYFVPDYELVRALKLAARIGVDVRLVMPLRSNHRVADMARNRALRGMLETGVNVYFEPTRMVHAKHILIDDSFALAGSANIDMRSLYFNYEVGLLSSSTEFIESASKLMSEIMQTSQKNTLPPLRYGRRWAEDFCWLMSPIL